MVLADTSIWADHFRSNDNHMVELLSNNSVVMHPFVLAEIALGSLRGRSKTLHDLKALPAASVADDAILLHAIESLRLHATGIGFVDIHILLSAKLAGHGLWTRDKRLATQAARLGVQYNLFQ
jgi:predicted nucleic acid-binding protein